MLIKDLPSRKKEVIIYKVQVEAMFCWRELPKAYSTIEEAKQKASTLSEKTRIVKRTDKGWRIVE